MHVIAIYMHLRSRKVAYVLLVLLKHCKSWWTRGGKKGEAILAEEQFLPIFDLHWCASIVVHGYKLIIVPTFFQQNADNQSQAGNREPLSSYNVICKVCICVTAPCRNQRLFFVAYFNSNAAFKVPYHWTSVKGRAHTRYVDVWISTECYEP